MIEQIEKESNRDLCCKNMSAVGDRWIDRQSDRQTDRQTCRQTDRQREREREKERDTRDYEGHRDRLQAVSL